MTISGVDGTLIIPRGLHIDSLAFLVFEDLIVLTSLAAADIFDGLNIGIIKNEPQGDFLVGDGPGSLNLRLIHGLARLSIRE
jgi:hypothetical protein